MSGDAFLTERRQDGIAILTLDRPAARNAISPSLLAELAERLERLATDREVSVVLLTGSGGTFSAGGDVGALGANADTRDPAIEAELLGQALASVRSLVEMPKPTIALINGAAAGGGLSLALACTYRIAAEGAKLSFAYGRIGLAGDLGMSWLLARLLGEAAARRFALLPYVDAGRAERIGLVDEVVPVDGLETAGLSLAASLAAIPPQAFAAIGDNLAAGATRSFADAGRIESQSFVRLRQSGDHREAIAAFLEKRKPTFKGA